MNEQNIKGQRFCELCEAQGISWAEIGRISDSSGQAVNNWKKRGVPSNKAGSVAAALGCLVSEISDADDFIPSAQTISPNGIAPINQESSLPRAPLINWDQIPDWISIDAYSTNGIESADPCHFENIEKAFRLRVIGDAMAPDYRDGEIILLHPIHADHGDDVVAPSPSSGKPIFRRIQRTPEGTYFFAMNEYHPDRKIRVPDDILIYGVVVSSWMDRRRPGR